MKKTNGRMTDRKSPTSIALRQMEQKVPRLGKGKENRNIYIL